MMVAGVDHRFFLRYFEPCFVPLEWSSGGFEEACLRGLCLRGLHLIGPPKRFEEAFVSAAGGGGGGDGDVAAAGAGGGGAGGNGTQEDEEAAIDALNQQAGSMRHGFANRSWTADGGGTGPNRSMAFGGGRGAGGGRRGARGAGMGRGAASLVPTGPVPPNYICRRCFQPGHWIQECPTNGDLSFHSAKLKRVVGIPTSMIKLADGDRQGGGLVNASGQLVTIRANDQAFRKLKEFGGGQSVQGLLDKLSQAAPAHLKCPICSKIMSDAVILPCCHKSTCDSCVRRALASSGNMSCPLCKTRGIGPDSLLPNEEEAAAAGPTASGTGGNKRKRPPQKGVDAILDLEPLERPGESADEEEEDPFGMSSFFFAFCRWWRW
eukprot:jgi/Undpi1/4454/HiC_scaffold_17.g07808.m1